MGLGSGVLAPHLEEIQWITGWVARRQCLREAEAEGFAHDVIVHLLEDDSAVLTAFDGGSRLSTYLATVILNLARDRRIREYGRWRPSAAALRLGTVAVELETLTVRDGFSFHDAVEILKDHLEVDLEDTELAELAGRLPARYRRQFVSEDKLGGTGGSEAVESRLQEAEHADVLKRAQEGLDDGLAALDVEDRLILKMRYRDGLTVAAIARSLGLQQQPLYGRVHRNLSRLQAALEARGVRSAEILEALGWEGSDLAVDFVGVGTQEGGVVSVPSTGGRD